MRPHVINMKIHIEKSLHLNLTQALRRAGYTPHQGRAEDSFVCPLSSASRYPQFHLYINKSATDQQLILNLHLDQRAPTYGQNSAHGGEYEGEVVEQEAGRIEQILENL